ncbi:MAG: type II toxin-antitoxin system VapC family toxin [Acidimicrobiales bacterium]
MSLVVVDASLVVAAPSTAGDKAAGRESVLATHALAGPHLLPVEVANILRRAEAARELTPDVAPLAHADLSALPVELFPYEPLADRVWELRRNLTAYDAWYAALAELLDAPLATLDRRLACAAGRAAGSRHLLADPSARRARGAQPPAAVDRVDDHARSVDLCCSPA